MNKNNLTLAVAGTLLAAGAIAAVTDQLNTAVTAVYYACKDGAGNVSLIREGSAPACKRGQTVVSWNNEGPQGLPGEPGTPGTNGQDGQPGEGVRFWRAANGNVVGRSLGSSAVEVNVGGIRTVLNVQPLRDESGAFTRFATFSTVGFSVQDYRVPRWSPNPDCSPPLYYAAGSAVGYDPSSYESYNAPGPRQGEFDLLIPNVPATQVNAKCAVNGDGSIQQGFDFTFAGYASVDIVNITDLYPAPLTLE